MQKRAEILVNKLELLPHPEGGYYKEVYRSKDETEFAGFNGKRNISTSIYFLLKSGFPSHFHKILSDELWHFYEGAPSCIHCLFEDGRYEKIHVGNSIEKGESYQVVIPANCWFAAEVLSDNAFTFVGCTVAPGFDFQDFTLAKRSELISLFPEQKKLIERLTID